MSKRVDKTGSCAFCGQNKIITVPEEWEQGAINEAVTCECECEPSIRQSQRAKGQGEEKNK